MAAVNAGYPRTVFNAGQVDNAKLILFTPSQGPLCEIHYPWANVTVFRSYAEEVKSIHNTEKRARIIKILCEAPFLQTEEGLINLINDYVHKVLEDADEEAARVKAATVAVSSNPITATSSAAKTNSRKLVNPGGQHAVIDLSSVDSSNGEVEDTAQSAADNPSVATYGTAVASESARVLIPPHNRNSSSSASRQKANQLNQPSDDPRFIRELEKAITPAAISDGLEPSPWQQLPKDISQVVAKKGKGGRPPPPPPGYFPSVPPPPPGVAFVKPKGAPKVGTKAYKKDLEAMASSVRAMQAAQQIKQRLQRDGNYNNYNVNTNNSSNYDNYNNYSAYEPEYDHHDDGHFVEVPNIGSALDSLSTLASQLTSADALPSVQSGNSAVQPLQQFNSNYKRNVPSSSFSNANSLRQYTERLRVLENLFKSMNKQEQPDTATQSSATATVTNTVTSEMSVLGSLAHAAATTSATINSSAHQADSFSTNTATKSLDFGSHPLRSVVSTARMPLSTGLRNYTLQSGVEYGEWCYPGRVVGVYDNGVGPARNHAIMLAVVVYKEHHGMKANRAIYTNQSSSIAATVAPTVVKVDAKPNHNNNSDCVSDTTKSDPVHVRSAAEKAAEQVAGQQLKKKVKSESAEQQDAASDSEVSVVVVVKKRGRKSNAERQLMREREEMERLAQNAAKTESTNSSSSSITPNGDHVTNDGESKSELRTALPTVSSPDKGKGSEHVTEHMDIDAADPVVDAASEPTEKSTEASSAIVHSPAATAAELSFESVAEEISLSVVEPNATAAVSIDNSGVAMDVEAHSFDPVKSVEAGDSKHPDDKIITDKSQVEPVSETANASSSISNSSTSSSSDDVVSTLLASKYTAPEDLSFPDLNFIFSGVVPIFLTFQREVEQFRMSDRNEFLCVDSAGNVCLWDRNDLDVSDKKVFALALRQSTEFRADGSIVPFHGVAGVRCLVLPQVEQESLRLQHRVLANKLITTQEEMSELSSLVQAQQQTIEAHSAILRDQSSKINLLLRNNNLDSKRNLLPEYDIAVSNSAAGRPLRESATVGTGSGNWKRKHNYTNNLANYHASRQNNSNNNNNKSSNIINNNNSTSNGNAAQNVDEERGEDSDSLVSASDHELEHHSNSAKSSGRPRKPKYNVDASKDTKVTTASAPHRTSRKAAVEEVVKKSSRSNKHSSRDTETRDSSLSARSGSGKRNKDGRGSLPVQHDLFNYKPPQLQKAEEPRQYRYGEQISKRLRMK